MYPLLRFFEFTFCVCLYNSLVNSASVNLDKHDNAVTVEKRASKKCMGELGCFDNTVNGPFIKFPVRPVSLLPQDRDKVNVEFFLNTRSNPTKQQLLNKMSVKSSVTNSPYSSKRETKFIVHGFLENSGAPWVRNMAREFLKHDDYNVISVSWQGGSGLPYTAATGNARLVGAEIGLFIEKLKQSKLIDASKVHIIGHSLGAHVAGYAGRRTKVRRISGMDPAEPYFQGTDPQVRLDPTDAQFVDALHSDSISVFAGGLRGGWGMKDPVGHVDFYPNGGHKQPGCDENLFTSVVTEGIYGGAKKFVACAHLRACDLYTESINNAGCKFTSNPCDSWDKFQSGQCMGCGSNGCAEMGFHADKVAARGTLRKFYLKTTGNTKQFCGYHYFVRITLGKPSGSKTVKGNIYADVKGLKRDSGLVQLNQETQEFAPGKSYGFVLLTQNPLGHPMKLNLKWEYTSSWYKPWQWGIFRNPSIYPTVIAVKDSMAGKTSTFCAGGLEMGADYTASFSTSAKSC